MSETSVVIMDDYGNVISIVDLLHEGGTVTTTLHLTPEEREELEEMQRLDEEIAARNRKITRRLLGALVVVSVVTVMITLFLQ